MLERTPSMCPFAPLELLSPARDLETARAAVLHGADAVYIGGPAFGARQAAGNSFEDLARIAEFAHQYRARVYMTLNTLIYDNEFDQAVDAAWKAKEAGVDALIVQDLGLLKGQLPDIEIHASTQCDIRTPEKAAFLDSLGFAQVVPARELTLDEIAAIRKAMPRARIEFFIAGALCVSYSGKCYLSAALTGRSANRGQCSQPCRLPYDVTDLSGRSIVRSKHVLSLKDNDQSANLEKLIAAGVSSFKIEGRLKGPEYVKNLTAYYRRKIDALLEKHAGENWQRASVGVSTFTFEPDPEKTFRRGATDYFVNGRRPQIAALDTPKSTGETVGKVVAVSSGCSTVDIATKAEIANGDGLVYLTPEEELEGLRVNRAEQLRPGLVRVSLHEPLKRHPGLLPGVVVNRNKDHRFEKLLAQESAERTIPATLELVVRSNALELTGKTLELSATVRLDGPVQPARNPQALDKLKASLSKAGGTVFQITDITVTAEGGPDIPFVPVSVLNGLRRDCLERLARTICDTHPRFGRLPATVSRIEPFEGKLLDFRANAANVCAIAFYKEHGASRVNNAFETLLQAGNTPDLLSAALMQCRHCVRHTLGLCPKQYGKDPVKKERFKRMNGGRMKPQPLILTASGGTRLLARFDCRACEMTVSLIPKNMSAEELKGLADTQCATLN